MDSFSGNAEEPSRNRKPVGSIHRLPRLAVLTSSKHLSFGRIECRFIEPGISAVQGTKQPGSTSVALS